MRRPIPWPRSCPKATILVVPSACKGTTQSLRGLVSTLERHLNLLQVLALKQSGKATALSNCLTQSAQMKVSGDCSNT